MLTSGSSELTDDFKTGTAAEEREVDRVEFDRRGYAKGVRVRIEIEVLDRQRSAVAIDRSLGREPDESITDVEARLVLRTGIETDAAGNPMPEVLDLRGSHAREQHEHATHEAHAGPEQPMITPCPYVEHARRRHRSLGSCRIRSMSFDAPWSSRAVSAADVVAHVPSGSRVFVHGAAATPTPLLEALAARAISEGFTSITCTRTARTASSMRASPTAALGVVLRRCRRAARDRGRSRRLHAVFLSDIPRCSSRGAIPLDVALVQLSPPDRARLLHARHLGRRGARRGRRGADRASPRSTTQMPRTHGDTVVPLDRDSTRFMHTDRAAAEHAAARRRPPSRRASASSSPSSSRTARRCRWASARSPTPCCARLGNKHDLGVHTEMFSDGADRARSRAASITNRAKKVHPGRTSRASSTARARSSTSSTTTRWSSSTPATAPTTPR